MESQQKKIAERPGPNSKSAPTPEKERPAPDAEAARGEQLKKSATLQAERDALAGEREHLAAQLAQARETHRKSVESLTRERDEIARELDDLSGQISKSREEHRKEMRALEAKLQDAAAVGEESETASLRAREQAARATEVLTRERDEAQVERDQIKAEFAKTRAEFQQQVDALSVSSESANRTHAQLLAEFSSFRETNAAVLLAVTKERDNLMAARDEVRQQLDTLRNSQRQELEIVRRECTAVSEQRQEVMTLLERDRDAWRRQIELFTEERDTLARERDEALVELTRERQTESTQIELRTRECENLVKQRAEAFAQVNAMRAAQKRQGELFATERQVLIHERDATAAKLERSLKSLGEDRASLLQRTTDTEARLEEAQREREEALAALAQERDAVIAENETLLNELVPLRDNAARESEVMGTASQRKYVVGDTVANDEWSSLVSAKDVVLEREVEMKIICDDGASNTQSVALFLEEARRLARLQHPNIPPIYDVGLNRDGRVFYTTKRVEGMTLRFVLDRIESGKAGTLLHFTLKRLLNVFHRVCDALAFAHANGVTHGGVKAEDVILGDFGEVLVTNWRLPRSASSISHHDPQEDIAALGRLLFEIATLEPPRDTGKDGRKSARTGEGPYRGGGKVIQSLLVIAKRAFDKKAGDRFHSVREFQTRADAFKDSFEDPSHITLRRVLAQWLKRRAVLVLVLLAIVLALIFALPAWRHAAARRGIDPANPADAETLSGQR